MHDPSQLQEQTRSHYNDSPFIEGGPKRIAWWREYLKPFLPDADIQGRLIADIGSRVGEISSALHQAGARPVCLDISERSLERCREINPDAAIFHGNALDLPFADAAFDHVISIGVLHHTPDCRKGFSEAARILAPGGTFLVFLYSYWSLYNLIFHLFRPVSRNVPLERVPPFLVHLFQPFAKTHLGQTLDQQQLYRLCADKLWTPQASFHSLRQCVKWGREEGLDMTRYRRFYLGYANVIAFRKQGDVSDTPRDTVKVRCLSCYSTTSKTRDAFRCERCGSTYLLEKGIYRFSPGAPAASAGWERAP